jgi:hypothetical protein
VAAIPSLRLINGDEREDGGTASGTRTDARAPGQGEPTPSQWGGSGCSSGLLPPLTPRPLGRPESVARSIRAEAPDQATLRTRAPFLRLLPPAAPSPARHQPVTSPSPARHQPAATPPPARRARDSPQPTAGKRQPAPPGARLFYRPHPPPREHLPDRSMSELGIMPGKARLRG